MFSVFLKRFFRDASILLAFLAASAISHAQSNDFRSWTEKRPGGVQVLQHWNYRYFPGAQGRYVDPNEPDLPGVGGEPIRSLRVVVPLDAQYRTDFMMKAGSDQELSGQIGATELSVAYWRPSESHVANPFLPAKAGARPATWDAERRVWTQKIPFIRKLSANATHVLINLYIAPGPTLAPQREDSGNLFITVHEAAIEDAGIIAGRQLAEDVAISVEDNGWHAWKHQPIRAGSGGIGAIHEWPHGQAALVEQRALSLQGDSAGPARDKRCVEDFLQTLIYAPVWLLERALNAPSHCTLDPEPNNQPNLPLIDIAAAPELPPAIDLTLYEAAAIDAGGFSAFDVAMNIVFCNDNTSPAAALGEACTLTDRSAIAAIGELSPDQIRALLEQIAGLGGSSQQANTSLNTGNAALDIWLNENWERAENALNAAVTIVRTSDAAQRPNKPVKKPGTEAKILKASCVDNRDVLEIGDDPWQQCIRKAKHRTNVTVPAVSIPPRVQVRGNYYLSDTREFDTLVRQFKHSGKSLPPGVSSDQFAQFTRAIGIDAARAGDNLGIVFLNDPDMRGGRQRFPFGLEHIWAVGSGGGPNAGHREDWQTLLGLSVNSRELLVQIVMAALTDPDAAYVQQRSRNGNLVRIYRGFRFHYGSRIYRVRNIQVVLGQNGMVISAFPIKDASADIEPMSM